MVKLSQKEFGKFKAGGTSSTVQKYTWETESGVIVSVISYGAIIQDIKVPNKNGVVADVNMGFDNLEDYVNKNTPYFGAAIGRCGNRIAGATFNIDKETYHLAKNNGQNHLHGGIMAFHKVNWESAVQGNKVIFSYLSKDGEEGYPGDVLTNIIYEVMDCGTLHIQYVATTTKKTLVNLTNHAYFNLAGHSAGAKELYEHVVTINADKITETNAELIPTGRLLDVGGTLYDLRAPTRLGDVLKKDPKYYDDNYCVNNYDKKNNFVARVSHSPSGRFLEVHSDQPGVQMYTCGCLPGPKEQAIIGKGGSEYRLHGAFCLETQKYPDAIHHSNFPSVILNPGEVYTHNVSYKFGTEK